MEEESVRVTTHCPWNGRNYVFFLNSEIDTTNEQRNSVDWHGRHDLLTTTSSDGLIGATGQATSSVDQGIKKEIKITSHRARLNTLEGGLNQTITQAKVMKISSQGEHSQNKLRERYQKGKTHSL